MRAAFARGLAVIIATNPLFPTTAIEQRLAWAGVPVDEYPYALVTTYENMHAAKPQPAYYREILAAIDCPPDRALMVGDDWKNDIAPAAAVGLHTFWTVSYTHLDVYKRQEFDRGTEPGATGKIAG